MSGVRLATEADIPAIFAVRTSVRQNHLSLEQLASIGITPESVAHSMRGTLRTWVGEEEEGEVVAFSMADRSRCTVWAMFVRPGHEGRGHGRRLMLAAEQWLFAEGCEEVWLRTDPEPAVRANGFYRRLGWTSIGVQEDGQVQYVKRPQEAEPS